MAKNIDVAGRLHCAAKGNVLAGADEILDDDKLKKQSEINEELIEAVEHLSDDMETKQATITAVVTPEIVEDSGTPAVVSSFENGQLSLAFKNLKGDKGDKGNKGDKGEQGDSAIWDENEPHTKLTDLTHVLGESTVQPMSQKGVTDAVGNVSDKINEIYEGDIVHLEITRNNGYVGPGGTLTSASSTTFFHTNPISVNAGYKIYVKISSTASMSVISRYNSDNNSYTPLVLGISRGIKEYTYNVEEDMDVVFSGYSNLYGSTQAKAAKLNGGMVKDILGWMDIDNPDSGLRIFIDNLINVESEKITLDNLIGYVYSDRSRISTTSLGFHTSPIQLSEGDILIYKGYAGPSIAAISKYENGVYTALQVGKTGQNEEGEYVLRIPEDMQVVLSGYGSKFNNSSAEVLTGYEGRLKKITESFIISEIDSRVGKKIDFNPISAFNNIVAIGDSLTYGQVYTSANTSRRAYRPWPEVVKGRFGLQECQIWARSGWHPTEAWENYSPISLPESGKTLAFVYLGTNGSVVDEYLETEAPEAAVDTYETSWADTNTGCYCKIVQGLINAGASVILVLPRGGGAGGVCPEGWSLEDTRRSVIAIADRFGVGYIDARKCHTTENVYHAWPSGEGSNTLHYNDWGYQYFAEKLIEQVAVLPENLLNRIKPI